MNYKCIFCNYRTISLQGLKMHVKKKHETDICPICGKKFRNLIGHFYIFSRVHDDSQHLLLYYLYTREILSFETKQKIEKLLTSV